MFDPFDHQLDINTVTDEVRVGLELFADVCQESLQGKELLQATIDWEGEEESVEQDDSNEETPEEESSD